MQPTHKQCKKNIAIYHKFVLLALALICKVVMTIQLRKYIQAGIPSISVETPVDPPTVWPAHPIAPVYLVFEEASVHYGLRTPISDAEWSSLAPNDGLIYLGDEHQVFSISMFHELRCLNIIRQGIVQMMDGNVTASVSTPALVQHCLNYIRQMIFCRSNTMLNGFVKSRDKRQQNALLGTHQCNDWGEIYKEVERNQDDHRRWMEGDELNNETQDADE